MIANMQKTKTLHVQNAVYISLIIGAIILGLALLLVVPDPLILIGIATIPVGIVLAYWLKDYPFELCLLFIVFSFFRIHEAFPILIPFRIPQFLAITTLLSLAWHYFGTRRIQAYWSSELLIFIPFFTVCTVGVVFATDRAEAWAYWSGTYVKIAIMTFATAWLTREQRHFKRVNFSIVLAGLAIAYVTLYNKYNMIGLVEGTRVTIGRDIGSTLGDPNDLSLILLFPLSFACALLVSKGIGRWQRMLGFIATPMLVMAIIATQSRGGLLGLIAVFAVIGRYKIKDRKSVV